MDRSLASQLAGTLAARFPGSRTPSATLEEWASALQRVDEPIGYAVVDRLSLNRETPPSFKAFTRAILTEKNALHADHSRDHDLSGQKDPCEFCGNPVENGPDAASRYDAMRDRWYNAHLSCADLHPGTRAN